MINFLSIKAVAVLAAALGLSLVVNAGLARHIFVKAGENRAAAKLHQAELRAAVFEATALVNSEVSQRATVESAALLADMQAMLDKVPAQREVYRKAAAAAPFAAVCKPGEQRVSAVNDVLGAQK